MIVLQIPLANKTQGLWSACLGDNRW